MKSVQLALHKSYSLFSVVSYGSKMYELTACDVLSLEGIIASEIEASMTHTQAQHFLFSLS